jgi:hypothetical protein
MLVMLVEQCVLFVVARLKSLCRFWVKSPSQCLGTSSFQAFLSNCETPRALVQPQLQFLKSPVVQKKFTMQCSLNPCSCFRFRFRPPRSGPCSAQLGKPDQQIYPRNSSVINEAAATAFVSTFLPIYSAVHSSFPVPRHVPTVLLSSILLFFVLSARSEASSDHLTITFLV